MRFNMTTSAAKKKTKKKHVSTLREICLRVFVFFLNAKAGFGAISDPPKARISKGLADLLRFWAHKQALVALPHSPVCSDSYLIKKKNDRRVPPSFRKEIKFKKRKVRKHLFVPHLTVSSDAPMVEDRSRNPFAE